MEDRLRRLLQSLGPAQAGYRLAAMADRDIALAMDMLDDDTCRQVLESIPPAKRRRVEAEKTYIDRLRTTYRHSQSMVERMVEVLSMDDRRSNQGRTWIAPGGRRRD